MKIRQVHEFSSLDTATDQLVNDIVDAMRSDIRAFGHATLTLPGGTTPIPVFQKLAALPFPWEKVSLALTDERRVPVYDDRSNELLLYRHLLDQLSPGPHYVSLIGETERLENSPHSVPESGGELIGFSDTVLLGMGKDGHVASLFSREDALRQGTLCLTQAPDGVQRISFTLAAICRARRIFLLFSGVDKFHVFGTALTRGGDIPVAGLISKAGGKLTVYYTLSEPI